VNEVNQSISADQNIFAQKEVELAENNLKEASRTLEIFQDKFGQLNVASEQAATTSFIASLEGKLVELKVEEASLRRQYQDPNAPEVSYIADQAHELEKQISKERRKAVDDGSRDLNSLAIQESGLNADVLFASEALRAARLAAENSRRASQRQQKFVVMLSEPQLSVAPDQNWRWQAFLGSIRNYRSFLGCWWLHPRSYEKSLINPPLSGLGSDASDAFPCQVVTTGASKMKLSTSN
jgi:capsular polysaccharide transport system permease protein